MSLVVIWLIVASILDFRKREVENWWTFSLITFILAFKGFESIVNMDLSYFIWGVVGLGVGILLCNLFYYLRLFGGGDAKFLIALGVVLLFSLDWTTNLMLLCLFLFILLFSGAIYGLVYCMILTLFNFRKFSKEFSKQFKQKRVIAYGICLLSLILGIIFFYSGVYLGCALMSILFFTPLLLIYAKSIENSCMQKWVSADNLTIGDLLVKPFKLKGKTIEPNWEGLSEKELLFIQKNYRKQVLIKYGIPFMPAFLIAFLALVCVLYCATYL